MWRLYVTVVSIIVAIGGRNCLASRYIYRRRYDRLHGRERDWRIRFSTLTCSADLTQQVTHEILSSSIRMEWYGKQSPRTAAQVVAQDRSWSPNTHRTGAVGVTDLDGSRETMGRKEGVLVSGNVGRAVGVSKGTEV